MKMMKFVVLLMFIDDVYSFGFEMMQGFVLIDSWYWNCDVVLCQWVQCYFGKMKKMLLSLQVVDYLLVMMYLKVVQVVGMIDFDKVMVELKKIKISDFYVKGYICQDGSMIYDMYLMEVKKLLELKELWDYYKVFVMILGEQVFGIKQEMCCVLWK